MKIKIIKYCLLSLFFLFLLTIIIYLLYVVLSYKRIEDNLVIENENNNANYLNINEELSVTSYNIGFGAYNTDFSFFLDEGYDLEGNIRKGKYSKAFSKDDVLKNTNGSLDIMKKLDSDFYCLQEVDINSTRSYKVNQYEIINDAFNNYVSNYSINFDTAYLFYPLTDPHGKSLSSLATLSKYSIDLSIRKSMPVSNNLIEKFIDYDRAFVVNYLKINNSDKYFVLINTHMSAFDKGGIIRKQQIELLNNFINDEYEKGNYVLVAGDFNHDLLTYNPSFNYNDENILYNNIVKKPDWLNYIFNEDSSCDILDNFKIIASDNLPSIRSTDAPLSSSSYFSTVDGFIISNNIEFINCYTSSDSENGIFNYSDHHPTTIKFKLK